MEIGEKVKRLRLQRGLTQEELAARTELSKGFISQLERDITSPSIATLMDILEALGTDIAAFFNEEQNERVVYRSEDMFIKEADDGGAICWLVTNAQRNALEPILVTLPSGAGTEPDDPHEGEEFGYVLQGTVWLAAAGRAAPARAPGRQLLFPPHRAALPAQRRQIGGARALGVDPAVVLTARRRTAFTLGGKRHERQAPDRADRRFEGLCGRRGARTRQSVRQGRRIYHAAGSLRLRQDDDAAPHRRVHHAHVRPHRDGRRGHRLRPPLQAPHQHGVSKVRAVPAPQRV